MIVLLMPQLQIHALVLFRGEYSALEEKRHGISPGGEGKAGGEREAGGRNVLYA